MAEWAKGKRFTADGFIEADDKAAIISQITIETDGTNAATVTIREGGASGTIRWQGQVAGADLSRPFPFPVPLYVADAHLDLTGTGAAASVAYVTPSP